MEYKDKLFKDKIDSMKQLDRIELQNIQIKHNQKVTGTIVVSSTYVILFFISLSFSFLNYIKYIIFSEVNLITTATRYLYATGTFGSLSFVFFIICIITFIGICKCSKESEKEMEEFIEERSKVK